MKRNIDLTQNRVFTTRKTITIQVDERQVTDPNVQLICGTASEREEIKRLRHYMDQNFCDRCGCRLSRFPWKKEVCLCERCDRELDKECAARYRWKYRSQERITNFVLIRMNRM